MQSKGFSGKIKSISRNYLADSSFFKEKYLSSMEIKTESIFSTDVSNFENMYRLSLDIYDNASSELKRIRKRIIKFKNRKMILKI